MGTNAAGKPTKPAVRVWRISASNPMGAWVDINPAPKIEPVKPLAISSLPVDDDGHWLMSSFDLRYGAEVSEDPTTVPGDLFDELFPPTQDGPKTPRSR
jgi:hypothetical protein